MHVNYVACCMRETRTYLSVLCHQWTSYQWCVYIDHNERRVAERWLRRQSAVAVQAA